MNNIELLSPVGEWNSLVSAVQNGANAVYFGADEFNARMNSKNFNREELKKAIEYAKLRNVKTNLTLNILIKNDEFSKANGTCRICIYMWNRCNNSARFGLSKGYN